MQKTLELRALANLRSQLGIASSEVDIPLRGGEMLGALGGLKVIHTPGHTPGSICLLSPRHKLLIAGDTLMRQGKAIAVARKGISTDPVQAIKSVRALATEDFDKICFGHHLPMMQDAKQKLHQLIARIRLRATRRRKPRLSVRRNRSTVRR